MRDELYTAAIRANCSEAQIIRDALNLYVPGFLDQHGIVPAELLSNRSDASPGEWDREAHREIVRKRLAAEANQLRLDREFVDQFPVTTRIKGE